MVYTIIHIGKCGGGNLRKMVKNNPEIIDQVKSAIGGLKSNKAIDDRSGLGNNFR